MEQSRNSLKAFTLIEVLVTLVISSLIIGFSYSGLDLVQKLLFSFHGQSRFISDYTQLQDRFRLSSVSGTRIVKTLESHYMLIGHDTCLIELSDRFILLAKKSRRDTFHLQVRSKLEEYPDGQPGKYLQSLTIKTIFGAEEFILRLNEETDAANNLNTSLLPDWN